MNRTYKELIQLSSFIDRYNYLKLSAIVCEERFGFDRYLNQAFYNSKEWRSFRNKILIRDNGCDLGIEDFPIQGKAIIHHINPLTVEDFENSSEALFDPNNVITVSSRTHQAIHYGDESQLPKGLIVRKPNDTIPWR